MQGCFHTNNRRTKSHCESKFSKMQNKSKKISKSGFCIKKMLPLQFQGDWTFINKNKIAMKNIALFVAFLCLILSTNAQDTLKLKTIKTYYGDTDGTVYHRIGELDGAVLDANTLSAFCPESVVLNISNDTFASNVNYESISIVFLYADTGLCLRDTFGLGYPVSIGKYLLPNDTMIFASIFIFDNLINYLRNKGIELKQINYWKMMTGIVYTSKDGTYSDSVFYAGADTVIFRIVKVLADKVETHYNEALQTIFPNPARSQFTITHTENASLQLYNMVGQEVLHTQSTEENTIINVSTLPQGLYMLKVVKDGAVRMYKIVVND